MDKAEYDTLYAQIVEKTPVFIDVQEALRSNGPVQRNQLVTNSEHMMLFCNNMRSIWTHCVAVFITNCAFYSDAFDPTMKLREKAVGLNSKKKEMKNATAEEIIRGLGASTFLDVLLKQPDASKSFPDHVVSSVKQFLEHNTAMRWISNLNRHVYDEGFEFSDEHYSKILEFLNNDDFDALLPRIAIGGLVSVAVAAELLESADYSDTNLGIDEIVSRIDKAVSNSETSSLKVYEQRLNNLVWGPKHYQRDSQFIRDASNALNENKIIAFFGLGGVGKTALAQKLMFDIINNREPFTHIVTHSSKVGSDQKEINTISPTSGNELMETNQSVSVMDSSLIEDRGIRVIGGLRNLLVKIYRETTGESGEQFSDVQLQKKVFSELRKNENQVLIVLDNFEDIEDNQDDEDVLQIKNETKEFLTAFSKLENIKSRVIITTRSSPLPVAYGIEVKHLTKLESANLFLEKLRFRSQRNDQQETNLSSILLGVHQKLSSSEELKNELIEAFDLWETHDEHIAHPLIVLLAAEDVNKDEFEHLREVIRSWSDGTKAMNVIKYCVSKTLGSFEPHEQELLRRLTLKTNLNSEMNTKFIREKLNDFALSADQDMTPIQKRLDSVQDNELIDLMTRLGDRTFVRVIPKRTTSGGTCWAWNKIVYDYLIDRYRPTMEETVSNEKTPQIEQLKEFPPFLAAVRQWTPSEPLRMSELITPLHRSVEQMMLDLSKHAENQKYTYNVESLGFNLDKQSLLLVKMLKMIEEHMKIDRSLSTLSSKTSVSELIGHLLKFLGRQARCWRYLSTIRNDNFRPAICVQYSLELLHQVNIFSSIFLNSGIIGQEQYLNLQKNIGKEYIEVYDDHIEVSGTLYEKASMRRLDWLEKVANIFTPEECSLKDGLELTEQAYQMFLIWIEVFDRTNLPERTIQLAMAEGYAFWIYLRLFSTDKKFADSNDSQILNELQSNAQFVRKLPNIHQYIQAVQEGMSQVLREPNEYLTSIINFRSQPTNGTLLLTPLAYAEEHSRWEHSLGRKGWKITVKETNQGHQGNQYSTVILVQESFARTSKRIVCTFHRGANGSVTREPKDSMVLMEELEKTWKKQVDQLITQRVNESRNELSFSELRRILENHGGPSDIDSVNEILNRITNLTKIDNYYVIDPNKRYSEPPPAYTELEGGTDVFSAKWTKSKIVLPIQPSQFAGYILTFINMLEEFEEITMRAYRNKIRNDFSDSEASGAFFIYFALGRRFMEGWLDDTIDGLGCSPKEFVGKVKQSVKGKCPAVERQSGKRINKKVIDSYFNEVAESYLRLLKV